MHGFPGADTVVETDGHIGHGAVLHGCRIGRNAMVGMNAVVMDGAEVGTESIVGAAAFVKAAMVIPPRSLVLGAPARVVRGVTDEELAWKSRGTRQYHELNLRSFQSMREVDAFTEPEPGRPRLVFDDPHLPKTRA
jgi:phenylacetic acid degradation protein